MSGQTLLFSWAQLLERYGYPVAGQLHVATPGIRCDTNTTPCSTTRCGCGRCVHERDAVGVAQRPYDSREYKAARRQLKANPGTQCIYCGRPATTVEHCIPIALGGDERDLGYACGRCNYSRGGKLKAKLQAANRKQGRRAPADTSGTAPPSRVW
jgi:5-methylcytosine-specific restriction endonuclease McrA